MPDLTAEQALLQATVYNLGDDHSGAPGEAIGFGGSATPGQAQDELFTAEHDSNLPSFSTVQLASPNSVSDMLRERISRAASRGYAQNLGHPHSILGATPHEEGPTLSSEPDGAFPAPSWPYRDQAAEASRDSPEPEPFGFESPTRLSTDDHLAVSPSDGDSEEREIAESSLPSVHGEDEEPQDVTFEKILTENEQSLRERLQSSARAASIILGDDTHEVQTEEEADDAGYAMDVDEDQASDTLEDAPITNEDSRDEDHLEETTQVFQDDTLAGVQEDRQADTRAVTPLDVQTEQEANTQASPREETPPATETDAQTYPQADHQATLPESFVQSVTVTVQRVPLKRSIEEYAADELPPTMKRRRRRSDAEMLQANAQSFIASIMDRPRRHSVAASTAVEATPEPRRSMSRARSRSRGRPRKSETLPRTTAQPPTTPRGRGRPPKAASASGTKSSLRTSKDLSTPSKARPASRAMDLETPQRRGRGRPRKTPAKSETVPTPKSTRGRGRPPKSTTDTTAKSHATVAEGLSEQPRGRGRPRKSLPTSEPITFVQESEPMVPESTTSNPAVLEPDFAAHSTRASHIDLATFTTQETDGNPSQVGEPPAPKVSGTGGIRRRGRPPKATAPTATLANTSKKRSREAVEETETIVAPEPKRPRTERPEEGAGGEIRPDPPRRRGRPRKDSTKQAETGPLAGGTETGATPAKPSGQSIATTRARRGRPRKT